MSEEEDEQIDYELSYDTDDIELELNNQSEQSDEDLKKEFLNRSKAKGKVKRHLPPVNKRFFRARRPWTRGRFSGGRLAHRLGDRKPNQAFRAGNRRGREGRRGDRSWSRELLGLGDFRNYRSRSKDRRSRFKNSKAESKNSEGPNLFEERHSKNKDARSSSYEKAYRRTRSGERVLKRSGGNRPKSDHRRNEIREQQSRRFESGSKSRDNRSTSRDSLSRNKDAGSKDKVDKSSINQPREIWESDQATEVLLSHHTGDRNPSQDFRADFRHSREGHSGTRSRSREGHIGNSREHCSRSEERRSSSKVSKVDSEEKGSTSGFKVRTYNNSKDREHCEEGHSSSENKAHKIKDRGSRSDEKESQYREQRLNSVDRSSNIRERQSKSVERGERSKSRGRHSRSQDSESKENCERLRIRDHRSMNRDLRSKSRSIESRSGEKNRDKRSASYSDRRSRSRGRRSNSRERQSRGRVMLRRSRSRERRSRSMERHFSNRERRSRSRSIKRNRRHSNSRSRSRSRSRTRRRRHRSYTRSKSSSSDVIVYQQKTELIDVDKYDSERRLREMMDNYGSSMISAYSGQPAQAPSFHHNQQYQVPPPPGIEPYPQPQPDHVYPPSQPPPAPYISNQTPPAPFISNQTPPGPPQLMGGPNSSSQQYAAPPPPILSQQTMPPGQFSHISTGQPEEYGGYQQNMGNEFIAGSFGSFDGVPQPEHFQSSSSQPTFNTRHGKDFGVNWKPPKPQTSSIVIYPQSGPESSNVPVKITSNRSSKKPGVEEEKQNQKQTLVIQRDQYLQKNASLQKELARLKEQRSELLLENSPDSERLLKENTKLQNEITQRLKAIENVVEMLSGLIKKVIPEEKENKYSASPSARKDYQSSQSPSSRHSQDIKKSYSEEIFMRSDRMEEKDRGHNSPKIDRSPPRRHELRSKENDEMSLLKTSPPPLIFPKLTRERTPPKLKLPLTKTLDSKSDVMKALEMANESTLTLGSKNSNPVNLIHYDPELHWCSLCNVFPKTVVDYLNHLHSPSHKLQIAVLKLDSSPWHADDTSDRSPPLLKNAPSKRIPIRGVQFLVPTTGWYCRLCKTWIGDMHCAQEHLKGRKHTNNYSEYTAQNPHWEVDWLSDRTKSFERSSENLSRLREKNESLDPSINKDLESEKAKFSALSDTLLAVLAQQNKRQRQPSTSSSSSTSSSEDDRKKPKKSKKKKSKKKKKKDESPERAHLNRNADKSPHVPQYRQKNVEDEDSSQKSDMITNWMDTDKSEPPISIKIKNKFRQESDRPPDIRPQSERHRESGSSKGEKYREDRVKADEKREMRDERYRDDRGPNRNWNRGREQYNNREQFNSRDQFISRDQYNRRDPRENKDFRSKNLREDAQMKKAEQQKKNLPSQRVEDQSRTDKRKSPLKVFQRPEDPLDRDSPEPVDKKDKCMKNDKPQGKLWFPSKEVKEVEEEEEPVTPFEKQTEESVSKKKTEVKKTTQFSLPKTKLPFIGRMPILKKKTFDFKAEETVKDNKSEKALIWPNIPGMKEGPEPEPRKSKWDVRTPPSKNKEELQIITKEASPDSDIISSKENDDNLAEQDMDITNDDQDNISWVDEGQKGDLHQDFQDALDLLFPQGDIRNKGNDSGNNQTTTGEMPHQGYICDPGFVAGVSVETSGHGGAINPSLGTEGTMIINLNVPPPIVPGGPPVRNDGPLLMPTMGPPPIVPGGPHQMGPGGPSPIGPGGSSMMGGGGPPPMGPVCSSMMGHGGQLPLSNEMPSLLTRPPPPIASGGSNMPPSLLGPSPHLPMGSMMGPRHMGPPVRLMEGQMMGPQGAMSMPMGTTPYSPEDEGDDEPVPKRKNAPSQRMRRYIQKKKAEAQAKFTPSTPIEQKRSKYEGMDVSDLAMLGIDEDDSIIT